MSVHLLECAAEIKLDARLTATHKLALLCFADSGSADTRIARPGLDTLLVWTCAKKSWAMEVVNDLVEMQLLSRHQRAYRGHRAEFVVFPNGCCERHGLVPANVAQIDLGVADPAPESAEINGSGGADPLISLRFPQRPLSPEPLLHPQSPVVADPSESNGSGENPEWVRQEPPNGSGGDAQTWSPPKEELQEPTPSGPVSRERLRRATGIPAEPLDPVVVADGGAKCRYRDCDNGWLVDSEGLPLSKCPECHPAFRGATA